MISEHVAAPESGVRAAAWVAWPVCVLSVAFAAFGLLFLFLHGSFAVVIHDESVGVNAVVAVVFPMVGAVIASRRPGNAVGWIFCDIGLFEGVSVFAGEYGRYFLQAESGRLPAGIVAVWLGT